MSGGLSCPARFQSDEAPSFRRCSQESQDEQEATFSAVFLPDL